LQEIKARLQENLLTAPLFDTLLFTKNLEAGYEKAFERYQQDLPLGHIYVGTLKG